MKKISYFIIIIVLIGAALSSFWVYQKYFKKMERNFLTFEVKRGDVQEVVRARGEIVSEKEFDLGFAFAGIVDNVFVKEGDTVKKGDLLVKADVKDLEAELSGLNAVLRQSRANLRKLTAGATEEELQILENKISGAKKALSDANLNLKNARESADINLANVYKDVPDILNDAHVKADDAVNNQTDALFSDDVGEAPQLTFSVSDSQLEVNVESGRRQANDTVSSLSETAQTTNADYSKFDSALNDAENNLVSIRGFLTELSKTVDFSRNLSQTDKTNYKTYINTGLTNVNTALSSINNAKQAITLQKSNNKTAVDSARTKVNSADSSLNIAESELIFKKAGARDEDVKIAEEKIEEIKSKVVAVNEKIKKSLLRSPALAGVDKILIEPREVFAAGSPVVLLSDLNYKIRADISELDIVKVRKSDKNDVVIKIDAIPGMEISGRVASIEPKEIIKEGDVYFRANIIPEKNDVEGMRFGMKTDLVIRVSSKNNVLKVLELTVYKRGGKSFVKVLRNEEEKEIEIETGISDGEFVEVVSGVSEGDIVVVSTD